MWARAVVLVIVSACAARARTCPVGTELVSADHGDGRVESCSARVGGSEQLPVYGRNYPSLLQLAHPSTMRAGVSGPFTHWYPSGGVESHGRYVDAGSESIPDGVWGFWYEDGERKTVGRYDHGQPVGCFLLRDDQGGEVTGTVDGDQLRLENCDPPVDALLATEARSDPRTRRQRWGDVGLSSFAQLGGFGASNPTQRDPDPRARLMIQAAFRKQLGAFRIGPVLGGRLSSGDTTAYVGGVVAAYALPLPSRRVGAEIEAELAIQHLDITARREGSTLVGNVSFWAPMAGARLSVSLGLGRSVELVTGASVDGWPTADRDRDVLYCGPFCPARIPETWSIGGAAFGIELGLRGKVR